MIAIRRQEAVLYGCPRCGRQKGYILSINPGSAVFQCAYCTKLFIIVEDSLHRATIPYNDGMDCFIYPEVSPHPRGDGIIDF